MPKGNLIVRVTIAIVVLVVAALQVYLSWIYLQKHPWMGNIRINSSHFGIIVENIYLPTMTIRIAPYQDFVYPANEYKISLKDSFFVSQEPAISQTLSNLLTAQESWAWQLVKPAGATYEYRTSFRDRSIVIDHIIKTGNQDIGFIGQGIFYCDECRIASSNNKNSVAIIDTRDGTKILIEAPDGNQINLYGSNNLVEFVTPVDKSSLIISFDHA
jgi:hypothetical protein